MYKYVIIKMKQKKSEILRFVVYVKILQVLNAVFYFYLFNLKFMHKVAGFLKLEL